MMAYIGKQGIFINNKYKLWHDKIIVKEFLEMSESSLNKIWLDPEEDEAWKDL